HFSHIPQVEVILVMLRIPQRSRFRVCRTLLLADIGVAQNTEAFRKSRHHAVLDPVVDHLHEMTAAIRAAVQVTELRRATSLLASGRALTLAGAGRQGPEDRIEMLDHVRLAPDHHAVPALQSPDAAAGSDIHVMDSFGAKLLGSPDVVYVIRVAAVDE